MDILLMAPTKIKLFKKPWSKLASFDTVMMISSNMVVINLWSLGMSK
jgi:hypothetical protein